MFLFEERAENIPNRRKEIDIQIKEAQRAPSKMKTNKKLKIKRGS